jgi:hypothetical protein
VRSPVFDIVLCGDALALAEPAARHRTFPHE